MKMSAILFKCLGDMKHLEINLGRCEGWGEKGFTKAARSQLFIKLVHTENFLSARHFKYNPSSLRMMGNA